MKTDKERKDRHARNKAWRKALNAKRQADYWRKRWETHPETMRSNLARINGTRKEKAAQRTQRLLQILALCPDEVMSWDIRSTMESAIVRAGFQFKAGSFKTLMVALRRRNLISFDPERLVWKKVNVA